MVSATPNIPSKNDTNSTLDGIKIATPDIILFNEESLPIEVMADLIFEDIGGQELIDISRNDLINGQSVIYQPIKNISNIAFQYNPQNILALQNIDKDYFLNFPINLNNHIPEVGSGPNGEFIYIDQESGNLVVDTTNMKNDYQIEIQIISSEYMINDTIYSE